MVIDEKIKAQLLHWEDKNIYGQFEKKCATLSKISGLNIDPSMYQLQYDLYTSHLNDYINFQTNAYAYIYKTHPEIDFTMAGRLKSRFSHYEKVIRKFIEQFEKDIFTNVKISDGYAIKVFIRSVAYDINKVSYDSNGVYVDYGKDEFRLVNNDVFSIPYGNRIIDAIVHAEKNEQGKTVFNIIKRDNELFISTKIDNDVVELPLSEATTYKKSNKADLVPYCKQLEEDIITFYTSKQFEKQFEQKFEVIKRKDYISRPKESGYESLQSSFYSEESGLALECQVRTSDMEDFNNAERETGYKPNEHKLSSNPMDRLPRFALTTRFKRGGFQTYLMSEGECYEYIYKNSFKEYTKKTMSKITSQSLEKKIDGSKKIKEDEGR